jgi:hypothetical protein
MAHDSQFQIKITCYENVLCSGLDIQHVYINVLGSGWYKQVHGSTGLTRT